MPVSLSKLSLCLVCLLVLRIPGAHGQTGTGTEATREPDGTQQPSPAEPSNPTLFPHSDSTRYLILGQTNIIFQAHGPFHSPYSGKNSFLGRGEYKTSLLGTLFLGFQLNPHPRFATDILYDEESSGGRGISEALGPRRLHQSRRCSQPKPRLRPLHGPRSAPPGHRLHGQALRLGQNPLLPPEGAPRPTP